jgi:N-acetylmuramoyl-L-alanine amidase
MTTLIYVIKTVLLCGLLCGYYRLFLRNRLFHGFNRFFLLAIPWLSMLLPALHFTLPDFWNPSSHSAAIRLLGVGQANWEEAVTIYAGGTSVQKLSWKPILWILSLGVTMILMVRLMLGVRQLLRLKENKAALKIKEARVYFVTQPGTPFSFFKSIFWGKEMDIDRPENRQILRHELFHVEHFHSLDVLLMETVSAFLWFNPFLIFIRRELRATHEYAADADAVRQTDSYSYASLLLSSASGIVLPLAHPFFKNLIKRRITMITRSNKQKSLLGRILILPLLAVAIALFSFTYRDAIPVSGTRMIRVVVDAGHGGNFSGASWNGLMEKDINLEIAKKIQSLAHEYRVEVIMSRETDITPGSNDLRQSLEYIAALPKTSHADLFISIHTDMADDTRKGKFQDSHSGFEIYIPKNSSQVYENSLRFGSALSETIKSDYTIEPTLKQEAGNGGNIYVLKQATVPALLIECGYLDNEKDRSYLSDSKGQEKIARDILEGIYKYGHQNNYVTATLAPDPVLSPAPVARIIPAGNHSFLDTIYRKVDQEASYPGGPQSW